MAHEIENGRMVYVGSKPWHNEGKQIDNSWSLDEIISHVYPETFISLPVSAKIENADCPTQYLDISTDEYQAITRSDGKTMAVMKGRYEIVQPLEGFQFLQSFIDTGLVTFETGMSLCEGRKLVLTGKIANGIKEVIKGDEIKNYLLFYMGFDGSLGIGAKDCNERVVCANTLAIAHGETSKTDFKFKHTKNVRISIERAKETILNSLDAFNESIESYQVLAKKPCNDVQLENYVRNIFEVKKTDKPDENSTKNENKIQYIIDMTLAQPDMEKIPAMRGTYWNAYNGVTRYLQHDYGRSQDNRTESMWFGQNANVSAYALELALNA